MKFFLAGAEEAPGKLRIERNFIPAAARAASVFRALAARLKPCPFKTATRASAALLVALTWSCLAQTTPTPPSQETTPQPPKGKVLFSRSTDENGQTTTENNLPPSQPAIQAVTAPTAEDAERQAVTVTGLDLDMHLRTEAHEIAVHALVTVRNDGKTALAHIPLQISSSLQWERLRVGGKEIPFTVATLNSDADHTGQLHEAAITLAQPLAPGATLQIDATYSGQIIVSAQRLLALGAPEGLALHSDWDCIGTEFTGLRGFGNVVWYPVASVPVILGDGARLFEEIGEQKQRMAGARFRLRLAAEFPPNQPPTVALVNGFPVQLSITDPPSANSDASAPEVFGVATASVESAGLAADAPSLFLAIRNSHSGANLAAWANPEDEASTPTRAGGSSAVEQWIKAAAAVTPFVEGWLGKQPRSPLTLLDLPDAEDAPYETGALLAVPFQIAKAAQPAKSGALEGILAHALTHAWITPPPSPTTSQPAQAWLNEGVAHFIGTLWVEKQQGRQQALETLEADRPALALAEPESPGQSAGQPLAVASSPAYTRTKAAYVFWMLRDIAEDAALSAALRTTLGGGNPTQRSSFEKLLEEAGGRHDLSWFFADWVDADKGLPDLSIASVFPSETVTGTWLVTVNTANSGYAAAEVPVTVRSGSASVTQRVLIPARGKSTQRIQIQGKPVEVQLNDGTTPETQATVHITKLDEAAGDSSSSNP
jgi:hypothetical protein